MYGKAILIIFIILFLLYLWNNITESVSSEVEKNLTFKLGENLWHSMIFFKVATILSTRKRGNVDIGNKEGVPDQKILMDKIMKSENTHIKYIPGEPTDTDDPCFTYTDDEITIKNVDYISGGLDIFPYYCGNSEINFDDDYYTKDNLPLFRSRLAILTQVEGESFPEDKTIEELINDTRIIKLTHINETTFGVISLDGNESLKKYLSDATSTIIMYIYEGIDFDDSLDLDESVDNDNAEMYKKLMNIHCSEIMEMYGNRHDILMHNLGLDAVKIPPTWMLNLLFEYIHKNIALEKSDNSNLFLKTLISNKTYTKTDEDDRDSLNKLYTDHLFKELKCFEKVSSKSFILALDDAYYRKKSINYSYINMIRKKINLRQITEPKKNICLPFFIELENYLKQKYSKVVLENNHYKKNYRNDIFFNYYSSDRIFMNKMGMEEKSKLKNRFEALYVEK